MTPAGASSLTWSRAAGDTFGVLIANNNVDAVVSADNTRYALAANPYAFGWDYQSYGVWASGAGTGSGTFGSMSIGASTAGANIPTSGSATFTGNSGGRYASATGESFFTSSTMTAAVNFVTRSVAFSTASTETSPDLGSFTTNNSLNMSGTLSYGSASNQITGTVITTGGQSGSVSAVFYGPSAQEIGGNFAVTGSGLEAYAGSFGGKR
jgi:hypothetical protein